MAGNYKPKREGYVSDIPTVRENENWKRLFNFTCVRSLVELGSIKDAYLAEGALAMALDSETTALSIIDLEIVGFSFCWGKGRSYYVPVGHKLMASPTGMGQFDVYTNLPMDESMAILFEMCYAAQRVVFFNYRYDARVFRKYGLDVMKMRHYDIQVLIWNLDTNMPYPSLKDSSLRFLGIKQQTFYELVSGREQDMNISYLSPEVVYEYAAADALCTYLLWVRWTNFLENNQAILELDNELERVLMFLEELPVWFDRDYALQLADSRQQKIAGLKDEIFEMCGVTFEVDSPKQMAEALLNAGVPLYKKTEKSGQFMTNEDALQEFEKEYPVVRKIMEYRTTTKELSTNIMPFLNMEGEYCHIKYNSKDVPCLTKEAFLLSKRGILSIKEVCVGDDVWTVSGWDKVENKVNVGIAPVWRVKLKDGAELVGTSWHPVMTDKGLKELGDLRRNDRLVVFEIYGNVSSWVGLNFPRRKGKKGRIKQVEIPRVMDAEFSQLLGFIAADGSVCEDKVKLCFWIEDLDLMEYYVSLFEKIHGTQMKKQVGDDNTVTFYCCSVQLVEFYRWLGVKKDAVPSAIRESGTNAVLGYLAGYFDGDGSVNDNGGKKINVRIDSIAVNRMRELQALSVFCGIEFSLHRKKSKGKVQAMLTVKRTRGSYERFRLLVPVKSQRKKLRPLAAQYNYARVVERVDPVGEDFVYDITMKREPLFIANGFVTHNTGRLSSGGADRKNTGTAFFLPMNIMSVPKPRAAFYMPEPNDGPDSVLGYRFVLIPKKAPGCVQGFDLDNVRRVIHAPAGFYYVAMDYDAQELVVAANLSKDRVFLDPLTRGEDPHDAVGLQMFGEEYIRAQHRKIMKILNYGCLYGGNGWTIQKQMPERSIEECDGYVERWSQVHRQYWNFMAGCTKFAKEHGYIKTAMGRIRRVRHWYQAQGKYGFANRTVWNTQIQGLCADIMRYVLVGIFYDIMMDPEFTDKYQFMADIHDEVDSIVTRDYADFTRIATKVQGIMTNLPEPMRSWEKPLTTGISVGPSWGELYPFVLQDGVWLPKVES